jgi:hypothetical protein
MLSHLMETVINTGEISNNEGAIIKQFLDGLFVREEEKDDLRFDSGIIQLLLAHLAKKFFERNEENAWMEDFQILKLFSKFLASLGTGTDTRYALQMSTQLGILVKNGNSYSFAHQKYLNHYYNIPTE